MTTPARPAERERGTERGEKKIFGINRNIVLVGGATFAIAIGYILYQRYKASQAAAAAAAAGTSTSSATGTGATTDTGSTDYSGELSVIQTELESVLANQGSASLQTTGTGTTTTTTGTGTGTTTTTTGAPAAPTGGHVVSVDNNDATVAWNANGASKWSVRIVGPGPLNGRTNTVTVPQAVYSGLSAGHNYEVYITPYSADGTAGPVGEVHFLTTK
jgi:hypothetical protein